MSFCANSKRVSFLRWAMLRRLPVSRLSTQTTWWPSASSASQRCEPMKPAPPVTKIRILPFLSTTNILLPSCAGGDVTRGTAPAVCDAALHVSAFLVVIPGLHQQVRRGVLTAVILAVDAEHVFKSLAAAVCDAAVAAP